MGQKAESIGHGAWGERHSAWGMWAEVGFVNWEG